MATFGNPENALKRAEELENVGRKEAALEALHDLITSKRHRYSWQKPLETIMFKYVELCLELRRGRFAKDGLIQYRNVCKQVNVSSLQEVIKYFLHLSTEKAGGAVEASGRMDLDHVEDLEAEKRPEDLMLSCVSVSGEKEQELVTPWLKFLWETYRTVLEVLRNNSKVEALYAMTAQRAFRFCLQYKRTTEFRRLCEIIRNHLVNLTKYRDQKDMPDLNLPETLQLYLDTRFEQLKVATELELWQEAFRAIEDIHGVMSMVKKTPKPQMMAIYYSKLTKIFWISESHLYHGYAWYKLFILQKRYNKNLTHKDLQLMASSVLLAAISVMPYDHKHGGHHSELKNDEERSLRMARLLGFSLDPKTDNKETLSRSALISELVSKGVMTYVPQTVKDLYHLLEIDFHPLDLADKVQPLLGKLSELSDKLSSASPVPEVQLEQYIPALERLTTLRVLQQVSQVYQTMKITALSRMIPFSDFAAVEKLSVDAAKCNFLQLKIDHLKGIVQFGSQDLESWDKIRNHLTILAKRLNNGRSLIHEGIEKVAKAPQHDDLPVLLQDIEKEHSRLLARKVLIERRKEEHERQMREMEREEESKKLKQQRIFEEAEEKRRASEYQKRKEERIRREIEEKESEEAKSLMLQQAETRKGKKPKNPAAIAIAIEGEKVTKQMVMEQAMQELLNKRQEMERKFHKLEKARDYLERAKREEEAPLIEAAYQKHLVDDEIFFQHRQQQGIEERRQRHVADVAQKKRLIRMLSDKNVFHNQVVSRREGEFERLKREREERVAEVRAIRKQEREMRRKMEHYRRQEAARLIKLKEEEEGRKREEEESKRKQDAERKAKLDEIAEKQKQRERELEEKERLRREDLIKEEQIGSKAASQPMANKFVPRALRKAVESAGSTEADNERWRLGDNRQSHVHAGIDGHPIPTLREADAPAQARDKYAPPSRKYEPPTKRTQTETQGKYERPPVVSGRLEPPPGGRDAQQGQGQGPPLGRYGQRPKYGAFGSGNTRDERDRDSDRWGASRGNTRDERDRDDHRGNTRDERDRDRWGARPDHREGQRDGDRSAMAADNWRRPSKPNQPDSHK